MSVNKIRVTPRPPERGTSPRPSKARCWGRRLVAAVAVCAILVSIGSLVLPHFQSDFRSAGPMHVPRRAFTVTQTFAPKGAGDLVVVIGGEDADGKPLSSWEVYDPRTKTFTMGGGLPTPRVGHTAARMRDGRIFIAGGWDGRKCVDECVILNPATGKVTQGPRLKYPRRDAVSVYASWPTAMMSYRGASAISFTGTGRVLIAGGASEECGIEYYDEKTGTLGCFAAPGATLTGATLTSIGGWVLLAGGRKTDGTVSSEAWIIDPINLSARSAGHLNEARCEHCAFPISPGEILIIGGKGAHGEPLSSTEVFSFSEGGIFRSGPGLLWPVSSGSACWWGNRYSRMGTATPPWRLLVIGGADGRPRAATQILEFPYTQWKRGPGLCRARYGAKSSSLRGVSFDAWHVIVMGGETSRGRGAAECEWSEHYENEGPSWFERVWDRLNHYLP